jgi:hypothetical protein
LRSLDSLVDSTDHDEDGISDSNCCCFTFHVSNVMYDADERSTRR